VNFGVEIFRNTAVLAVVLVGRGGGGESKGSQQLCHEILMLVLSVYLNARTNGL
jgi:hypothetical protein